MTDDRLFSSATAGLLVAMTALQRASGVEPDEALRRAVAAWDDHTARRGNDTWAPSELAELVSHLTRAGSGPA